MKKYLFLSVLVAAFIMSGVMVFADGTPTQTQATTVKTTAPATVQTTKPTMTNDQPFGGKLKIEGYTEYISFQGSDIGKGAWGGGILARYLFLDWLGAQTNVSFYGNVDTKDLPDKLSFSNWRLSLILHGYAKDLDPKLYGYVGGGFGYQFNDDVQFVKVDGAFTGHVLGGVGYDITKWLNLEAEVGYQWGSAGADNYIRDNVDIDAWFVRLGAGVRF